MSEQQRKTEAAEDAEADAVLHTSEDAFRIAFEAAKRGEFVRMMDQKSAVALLAEIFEVMHSFDHNAAKRSDLSMAAIYAVGKISGIRSRYAHELARHVRDSVSTFSTQSGQWADPQGITWKQCTAEGCVNGTVDVPSADPLQARRYICKTCGGQGKLHVRVGKPS